MEILNLEDNDITECLDIYNYYIKNTVFTLEEEELDLQNFKKRCAVIRDDFPFIVIKDDDKVVGYAYLNYFNTRGAYKISADLSIYVSQNYTKRHIGKILLDEITKLARAKGTKNIISIITSENNASVAFHEKNGFIMEGFLKDVANKFNRSISIYYYRLAI